MAGRFWATRRGRQDALPTAAETVDRHFWDLFDPPADGTTAPATMTPAEPGGPSDTLPVAPEPVPGDSSTITDRTVSDGDVVDQNTGTGSLPVAPPHRENGFTVSQLDTFITELLAIEGATGAAVVDIDSGMALATGGNPGFDLNIAGAGNSNVVRAKLRTMADLNLGGDRIEDILITLSSQYHIINVLGEGTGNVLFVYLVLNRATANLALARHKLRAASASVSI